MTKAEIFLKEFGLHEECYDFEEHVERFTSEMDRGLSGLDSSLLMLPSYLCVIPERPPTGNVIAIDAGGTNLRVALVRFSPEGFPDIDLLEKHPIPGSGTAVTKDEFFSRVADYIGTKTEESDKAGFCFSFPCEIGEDRDGKIIWFDKEVKVMGSTGLFLKAELNSALAKEGKEPLEVTVLNDTAAALIGAVITHEKRGMGAYIGLVYGTGVNICYYDPDKKMLINTEAGGYSGFSRSVCDIEIDRESEDPGRQVFEKMVSGAYFSIVALKAARLAAKERVLSPLTGENFNAVEYLDPETIDNFMKADGDRGTELGALCASDEDADLLFEIFDGLYERAAKLVAIAITATLRRCGATAEHRGFIVAEGSAFRRKFMFRERFERHIMAFVRGEKPYELVLADDHALIGAAVSVFL